MIRDQLVKWASITFREEIENITYNQHVKAFLKNTNFYSKICNRQMDGYSVVNLGNIDENNRWFHGFNMTSIFHDCNKKENNSPGLYILKTTEEFITAKKSQIEEHKLDSSRVSNRYISGYLARFYRSYASLLRDLDAKEKLVYLIESLDYNEDFDVIQDPETDAKRHADILLYNH